MEKSHLRRKSWDNLTIRQKNKIILADIQAEFERNKNNERISRERQEEPEPNLQTMIVNDRMIVTQSVPEPLLGPMETETTWADSEIDIEEPGPSCTLKDDLKQWANRNSVNRTHVTSLLKVLHKYHNDLPKDYRTLLGTPKDTLIAEMQPGSYLHFGLSSVLKSLISNMQSEDSTLNLSINIDGLPLFESNTASLWPILVSLTNSNHVTPFGIYFGMSKPRDLHEFLSRFVEEYNTIQQDGGFLYNGKIYNLRIKSLICDTPAKSFILQVKHHTGFYSCTKCKIKGFHNRRMFFPSTDSTEVELRTDEEYRMLSDEEFHQGPTPLTDLTGFHFIHNIPLDYMHLVCLGITKKLLQLWQKAKMKYHLNAHQIHGISDRLKSLKEYTPAEFNRKPRSLEHYCKWKATEYRQFLMYVGCYSIETIVNTKVFLNFKVLMCAMRLLSKEDQEDDLISYAHQLIEYFLKTYKQLYSEENMSFNVHNLLHLADDVKIHGNLDNFSAFKFENYLFKLKKLVKKSSQPLQQINNRFVEGFEEHILETHSNGVIESSYHLKGPLPSIVPNNTPQYSRAYMKNVLINTRSKANNCFVLKDDTVVLIKNIFQCDHTTKIYVKKFRTNDNVFDVPCESKSIGIHLLKHPMEDKVYHISDLKSKVYLMSKAEGMFVGVEMIHTVLA